MLFILSHCSIDNKSGLWKNKNNETSKNKVSEINFKKDLTFNEFKNKVILYGKNSKYPSIKE